MTGGDQHMKCEAMLHLEMALDRVDELEMPMPSRGVAYLEQFAVREEIKRRLWGALYLVQAIERGHRPANWNDILSQAREYDARAETQEVLEMAKQGHFAKKP